MGNGVRGREVVVNEKRNFKIATCSSIIINYVLGKMNCEFECWCSLHYGYYVNGCRYNIC